MALFQHQSEQHLDEENPPQHEETCFPELIDPFSPSLAVQIKSYQRQRQKKIISTGDALDTPSQSIQECAPDEENILEKNLSHRRLSWGSERAPGLCHQNCSEAPVEHDRGRRADKGQYLPPSRRYNSGSRPRVGESRDDTTTQHGAHQVRQSGNGFTTQKNAYASSSTSTSPLSTPSHSRPVSIVPQTSPFTCTAAVPSMCFLPHHKEAFRSPFSATTSREEPLKVRLYVLIVRVILPQIYLHCLLRVPYLYLSRVHEIFQDSTITLKDFENLTLMDGVERGEKGSMSDFSESSKQSYARMKANWEMFIDGLMREWKTFNIISGLLLSGILSIFQAEGANAEPITRYAALCSLVSALISLIYGCFFIIRFGSMRRVSRGVEWAFASCSDHSLIWNVYVLLAMPIIWLIWSIIAFIVSIMAFMFRVRPGHEIPTVSQHWELTFRLFVCLILGLGMAYAVLIISTLRHYGAEMDKAWNCRMREFWNRRSCDHGSRGKRQSQRMSANVTYVIPPTPSPTLSTTKAYALERLEVFPASTSPPPTFTSPTLVSISPSPKKRHFPPKFTRFPFLSRSSADDGSTSPVVVPPTPTHSQSSANSYMEVPSNLSQFMPPVNESPLLAALPLPPTDNLADSLPLVLENTNERIPPSFSRRPEGITSSSSRGSWGESCPITDMRNDGQSHDPLGGVIAIDPFPVTKEPNIQVLPLAKPNLKSQVNSLGVETGEQQPQSTGEVGDTRLRPHVSGFVPLSRPPNIHRPISDTIPKLKKEKHRRNTDTGGSNHPGSPSSTHVTLPRPPNIHRPTSDTIVEVAREEYRTDVNVSGNNCPRSHVSSRIPLSGPPNDHRQMDNMTAEVRREEYRTDIGAERRGKTKDNWRNGLPLSKGRRK